MKTLEQLKAAGEAPEWLENSAFQTLRGGYLFGEETPKDMYRRVASTVSRSLKKPELEARFFDILWKNWLCPSTPVLCNAGTDRGLPISCFSSYMADDTYEILETLQEVAMLSKYGGGTAIHINDIRPKGAPISKGGHSDGVVPFMKMADSVILGISQGSTRR